ncbi:MAG: dihydroorotate dehydrogenase electron transfer subunit [Thermoprotei archaeon]|nr:MAG: dihydroorotate dehydrogenase electron transfer subunit [Thermoprotei archaeon]
MYIPARIAKTYQASVKVKIYELQVEEFEPPTPGQFVMMWIPRVGEIPLSIAYYREGMIKLAIAKRGKVTTYIHEKLKEGDRVYLRGPYGRGFTLPRTSSEFLVVGGGTGSAPLYYLARIGVSKGAQCDALLGFETEKHLFFINEFKKICRNVYVVTENGGAGAKGLPTHYLANLLAAHNYETVYTCGPEMLLLEVLKICDAVGVRVEASLERLMKCAVGVCGACVLDPLGLRVCKDGPVFSSEVLRKISDLGKWWRDFDGRKIRLA